MDFSLWLCVIAILFFIGGACFAAGCKNKLFNHNFININKVAAECGSEILKKYGITQEDEVIENDSIDDTEDEYSNIDDSTSVSTIGRVYENTVETHNSNSETSKTDKITKYPSVEMIKGNQKYGINKNNIEIRLSQDIYNSSSLAAVCTACYEATKLCEGIDKPIKYKIIFLITLIPRIISQFSWILVVLCLFGMLYLSKTFVITLGLVTSLTYIISCLEIFYYYYISQRTIDNLIELNIITDETKEASSLILKTLTFVDMTNFAHSFKWFANKILGYRW
jgi:Zn-dependent membrane protease YugP